MQDQPVSRRQKTKEIEYGPAETVISCIGVLWIVAIIVGLLLHTDLTYDELRAVRKTLPWLWFDNMLRRYGALLPIPAFACRWFSAALAQPGRSVRPAYHFAEAGCIYFGLSVARLFIYIFHIVGILHLLGRPFITISTTEGKRSEVLSDHLFLGSSLTAILTTELILAVRDWKAATSQKPVDYFGLISLCAAGAISTSLVLGIIIDMFYTAKYFHGPSEIFSALILGWLLFQAPMAYWLLSGSAVQKGHAASRKLA